MLTNNTCRTCKPSRCRCGPPKPPTPPSGDCCDPLGILVIDVAGRALITLSTADLQNASHPTRRYLGIRLQGSNPNFVRLALPPPASNDDAYKILVENRTPAAGPLVGFVLVSNDPTSGDGFNLQGFLTTETSLEREIQDGAVNTQTFRTDVLVTVEGAYRVPGFTIFVIQGQ